jgi:hypothetical protein
MSKNFGRSIIICFCLGRIWVFCPEPGSKLYSKLSFVALVMNLRLGFDSVFSTISGFSFSTLFSGKPIDFLCISTMPKSNFLPFLASVWAWMGEMTVACGVSRKSILLLSQPSPEPGTSGLLLLKVSSVYCLSPCDRRLSNSSSLAFRQKSFCLPKVLVFRFLCFSPGRSKLRLVAFRNLYNRVVSSFEFFLEPFTLHWLVQVNGCSRPDRFLKSLVQLGGPNSFL